MVRVSISSLTLHVFSIHEYSCNSFVCGVTFEKTVLPGRFGNWDLGCRHFSVILRLSRDQPVVTGIGNRSTR